jgi:hypothetical protein
VERELRALGEAAQQDEHERGFVQRMGADQVARGQHHVELVAADDVAHQQQASQQGQPASTGDGERHAGTLARIGAAVPVADEQEGAEARELPEHHQQHQVVGQHHAEHGAHEEQQEDEEAAGRALGIVGVEVPGRIEHDECADAADQQRKQPRQAVHAKAEVQAQLRQPGHAVAQHLAGKHGRCAQQHERRHAERHRTGHQRGCAPRRGGQAAHQQRAQPGQQRSGQQPGAAGGAPSRHDGCAGFFNITTTSVITVIGTTKLIITVENAPSASCCCEARIR